MRTPLDIVFHDFPFDPSYSMLCVLSYLNTTTFFVCSRCTFNIEERGQRGCDLSSSHCGHDGVINLFQFFRSSSFVILCGHTKNAIDWTGVFGVVSINVDLFHSVSLTNICDDSSLTQTRVTKH